MFKYKKHLSFYELVNLINYAIELNLYNDDFSIKTHKGYDNVTPIINNIFLDSELTNGVPCSLSIFKNNFLRTKNNSLDSKISILKEFLNVDNNIIKTDRVDASLDKLVLYDKYNYDKFLYYKYTPTGYHTDYFFHTYMNNHIENFKTTCEIDNLNYDYIILLNDLLYQMTKSSSINLLENENYIWSSNVPRLLQSFFGQYVGRNEQFIRSVTNVNLPTDFINEATQIIIQNSKKLDILLNDIITYLNSTSELFNVYVNEISTNNETTTNESNIVDSHNKTTNPVTKTLAGNKQDTINSSGNNKTVDYIINDSNDVDNINNLKKNKYADKLVFNDDTQTNSNSNVYTETLTESENVTNETFNRNADDNKTKTNNSTFKRYKGIDIDIKTYQEIVNEIINIPEKIYGFLRLGVS